MNRPPNLAHRPEQNDRSLESELIADCIEAWELARRSYAHLLIAGVNRPDTDLARDASYLQLLMAGQKLHRIGGSEALGFVSAQLGQSHLLANVEHFERLWCGLVPEKTSTDFH